MSETAPLCPPTVPASLYDAFADKFGYPFADSYLWGAVLSQGRLLPHTVTQWMVLAREGKKLLKELGIELEKPDLWPGRPPRRSFQESYPSLCDNDDFRAFKRKLAKAGGAA